jgi:hypothetical protein
MDATQAGKTQEFVPIKEIRNGVIILKDGGYRGILICSAINFGLKSAEEQRAITIGFQNFLNTLDFSIQILINSRRMDMRPYLAFLEEKAPEQKSELMRIQLREYIEFIRSFSDQTNIMTKSFYVIVDYAPQVNTANTFSFLRGDSAATKKTSSETSFEEQRSQLEQRLSLVAAGLAGTGVRAVALGTEEIIELLYRSFNPGELENPIRLAA